MAERLEVSERTVHRDMEALSAAGVPVYALRGAQGGWQLDEHWRTQVPGLEDAELRALLMAQPRVIGDAKLAAAAERAIGKLMAALPVPMRAKAVSMRQRLHVDTTGWRGTSENLTMLPIVQDAVARDRKLAFRYRRPGQELEARVVDPLGLVSKGSSWYLVANTPRGMRTYRVSRIEKARILDMPSQRPTGFDLATYWKTSTAQFVEAWRRFEAVLRLNPKAASWVKMWRVASPVEGVKSPDAEGWSTFRVQFEAEEEASFVVLGLGVRAEVVEPASLRDRVAAEITRVVERREKLSGIQPHT